jgi:hypothetical protein
VNRFFTQDKMRHGEEDRSGMELQVAVYPGIESVAGLSG